MSLYKKITELLKQKFMKLGLAAVLIGNSGCKMPGNMEDPPNEPPYFDAPTVYVNDVYYPVSEPSNPGSPYSITINEKDTLEIYLNPSDPEYDSFGCDFLEFGLLPGLTCWNDIDYICTFVPEDYAGRSEPYSLTFKAYEIENPSKQTYQTFEVYVNDTIP